MKSVIKSVLAFGLLVLAVCIIAPMTSAIDSDDAWISSVENTALLMQEYGATIDEQIFKKTENLGEEDPIEPAKELRQKMIKALDASEGYKISPESETTKDEYESALKLYIMNLDDMIDALETMNANGYVEGSRAMTKLRTAFSNMKTLKNRVFDMY